MAQAWTVRPVSSLHKLTATAPGVLEAFPVTPVQLRVARGEWECFQFVITAGETPLREMRLKATGLATPLGEFIPSANLQLFREHYAFIATPSGNRRLEKLWWPDALIPLDLQPVPQVEPHRSVAFWAALRVPPDTKPGEYYGAIDIVVDGEARSLAVSLQVEPVTLPTPTMRATVAVYYDAVRDWLTRHGSPQDEAQFAALKKSYYDFLLDFRLNAYDLPVAWDAPHAQAYLRDARVTSVRLPSLDAPDFAAALAALKRAGALSKAFYYRIDEPPPERFEEVRQTTARLHAIDPALRHLVTVHPNDALQGAVDIWCPNIGDIFGLGHLDLESLARQRKQGRQTWWYTMVEPRFPYPTWLIDDDASSVRIYGAMMAKAGINGFVYSMAHGWSDDPFNNPQTFGGTWGDGLLLYPSEPLGGVGPIPSIRLMLLREAIEDYELLMTLSPQQRRALGQSAAPQAPLFLHRPQPANWETWRNRLFQALKTPAARVAFPAPLPPDEPTRALPRLAPRLNGLVAPGEWPSPARLPALTRQDDTSPKLATTAYAAHDGEHLLIAMRCREPREGDWTAVEIAPADTTERWRFVVTAKANMAVERHTREGQFRIEGVEWKGATQTFNGFYDVEMRIPLSVVGDTHTFRLNVLRRTTHVPSGTRVLLRAFPDAGDVTRMPLFTLQP